jgi:selenocysteine-specific elongation factor
LDETTATGVLQALLNQKQVVQIGQQLMTADWWEALQEQAVRMVAEFHQQTPLRSGMAREALRSRLKVPTVLYNALLEHLGATEQLAETGTAVHLPSHSIQFNPQQAAAVEQLMARFADSGVNSPSVKESKAAVGEEIYSALLDLGLLHPLNEEVVYATAEYEQLVNKLRQFLHQNGTISAAQARDLLLTTRKYAIALLEHLDDLKITRRVGDVREYLAKSS